MSTPSSPLIQLFETSRHFLYDRGDTILRAGDTPSGVYLITAGWVKIYSLCNDGEANIIMSLGPGDVFPLSWALTGSMHDVTFAAIETTSVLRIPREHFARSLANDEVSQAISQKLAKYSLRLEGELDNMHYHSARERVAFRLLTLVDSFGRRKASKVVLNTRVPNEYIARSSNMTRETASREMSRFARKGIIRNVKGYVVIVDIEALKSEAGTSSARHVAAVKASI